MRKRRHSKSNKRKKESTTVKEKVAKILEIPEEVVSDRPKITTVGKKRFSLRTTAALLNSQMKL